MSDDLEREIHEFFAASSEPVATEALTHKWIRGARHRGRITARPLLASAVALLFLGAAAGGLVAVLAPPRPAAWSSWQTAQSQNSPPPRSGGKVVYDGAHGVLVLFGGISGRSGRLNDTWTWDGNSWGLHEVASAPAPRDQAAMAFDAANRQVVLFGGDCRATQFGAAACDDTWTWDGSAWTRRNAPGPTWSVFSVLFYDPLTKGVTLITPPAAERDAQGLSFSDTPPLETWRWTGSAWLRANKNTEAGAFGQVAYDSHSNRVVMIEAHLDRCFMQHRLAQAPAPACTPDPSGTRDSRTWTWDGTSWRLEHPDNAPLNPSLVSAGSFGIVAMDSSGRAWTWSGHTWNPISQPNLHGAQLIYFERLRELVSLESSGDPSRSPGVSVRWSKPVR